MKMGSHNVCDGVHPVSGKPLRGGVHLMDNREIGQRIAHWRRRRGLSQALFADRVGKSKSWVEKIEAGKRRASVTQLEQIAVVLRADLNALIRRDQPPAATECLDYIEIGQIRDALLRYESITATFSRRDGSHPDDGLQDVAAGVRHCWTSFQASRYTMLGRNLPGLIASAQWAVHEQPAGHDGAARGLLSQTYQLAASTLRKCGEPGLEVMAAERALAEAERAGDPLITAGASFRLANAVLDMGDSRRAVEMFVTVAGKFAKDLTTASADLISLYGHTLLQGAMAATGHEDRAAVRDLLGEADAAAARLGGDGADVRHPAGHAIRLLLVGVPDLRHLTSATAADKACGNTVSDSRTGELSDQLARRILGISGRRDDELAAAPGVDTP